MSRATLLPAVALLVFACWLGGASAAQASDLAEQVNRLVRQLNDDTAARRDAAEQQLLDLAGQTAKENDAFLDALPAPTDQMPPAVRDRITRIRSEVEMRAANTAVAATTLTLEADQMPLAAVFAAIELQTGNKLSDNRAQLGHDIADVAVTAKFEDKPFWPAIDEILDQAGLGIYNYSGEDALAIVAREEGAALRRERAVYSGPFRFEIHEVQGQRSFRNLARQTLKVGIEVAWEPRLRPIALEQDLTNVVAVVDDGEQLGHGGAQTVIGMDVTEGSQATEFVLPLALPPRTARKIDSLRGSMEALVPGREVTFRFDDLAKASGRSQRRAGVEVTIDSVRNNDDVWEIHMRLTLEENSPALESHRYWPLQNVTYLQGEGDEPIDYVGLETTRQTSHEVGVLYLFDLPDGIDGLTWVYVTPASILKIPVEYEFKDIELP